jgi:CBS domain containing-hemolysin-like protein
MIDKTKQPVSSRQSSVCARLRPRAILHCLILISLVFQAVPAQASLFKGESLDRMADILAWVVLVIAPVVALTVFWLVHILPEKIAEQRKHPQAKAIQTLCLLSLVFGGLLWPIAWLWAYSKPVLYKLAYGTDTVEHGHTPDSVSAGITADVHELQRLRARVAELETTLAAHSEAEGGKS